MEVKMWRCYTATTIQSIRVMDDYSQRSFNKVNLVAQREQLWAIPEREQRGCCFYHLTRLSAIGVCTPRFVLLLSLSSHRLLNTPRCVWNFSCRAAEVEQRAASLEQPELWNVLSAPSRLLTHERKLFPHLFEILLELFSQSIHSSRAY